MKRKTFASIGGVQPVLFCLGMYLIALFFSVFVCSSIFYAINPKKPSSASVEKPSSFIKGKETLASVR